MDVEPLSVSSFPGLKERGGAELLARGGGPWGGGVVLGGGRL